jgi:hypothetical protein
MANAFPIKLTIALPGQPALSVALSRYSDFMTNFTVFWTDYFVPLWYAHMVFQYTSQGADTGPAWPALTARYAAWKMKHFPGQPIGVLTGATRESLTHPTAAHSILTITKDAFIAGTDLPYPIFLQLGTSRMRARPPMRVTPDFMTQVGKALQEFAHDAAGKLTS